MQSLQHAAPHPCSRLHRRRPVIPRTCPSWRLGLRRLASVLLLLACLLAVIGYDKGEPVRAQSTPPQVLNYLYIPTQSVSGLNTAASIEVKDAVSLRTETIIPIGTNRVSVWHVAVAPNGERVYVTYSGGIIVIDAMTNTIQETLPYPNRREILISQDSRTAYLRNGALIEVLDLAINMITATIDLGGALGGAPASAYNLRTMTFSLDGSLLYASAGALSQVVTLDLATNSILNRIPVADVVLALAVAPGNRLYTIGANNLVTSIDLTTSNVVAAIPVSGIPAFLAVTLDGTRVYVADAVSSVLSVIDPATNSVSNTIALHGRSTGIATGSDGRIFVLTYDFDSGYVEILHAFSTTLTFTGTPRFPTAIGFLTVAADRITVNSRADPGTGGCNQHECTLREALALASMAPATVTPTIAFNIPGDGPHTIQLTSNLPTISRPLVIDGYTQPGAHPNTNPITAGTNAQIKIGLDFAAQAWKLDLRSDGSIIRGLAINGASGEGISITGRNHQIVGNFIGADYAGTVARPNGTGIVVNAGSAGTLIGGAHPADRNLISGNRLNGILLVAQPDVAIQGNFIGIDSSGQHPLGNRTGIQFGSTYSTERWSMYVGGQATEERNVISGNHTAMQLLYGSVLVQNNYIGTDVTGTAPLGNSSIGIEMVGFAHRIYNNLIAYNEYGLWNANFDGPDRNLIAYNTIMFNKKGISVARGRAEIRQNSIYRNDLLGIDLGNDGPTLNDLNDHDSGPNDLLNYPSLGIVGSDGAELFVYTSGWLNNRTLGVELFAGPTCHPSGYGEGEHPIGGATLTKDEFGRVTNLLFTFPVAVPPGSVLTATATDFLILSGGDRISFTSEFSPCRTVAGVLNHHLNLVGITTRYDPALTWPHAPAGTFTITATFQTIADAPLTELFFKVKTLTNNNRLWAVIGGPGDPMGVGAVLLGPKSVAAGETFTAIFHIGLAERKPFTFLVDTYGVSAAGYATTAASTAETGFTYTTTAADLQTAIDQRHPIYLPLINR